MHSAKNKNKETLEVRPRDGHVEHVRKNSGSQLLKTVWTFRLLC